MADIAADGGSLLLAEASEAGGPRGSAFLQKKDGTPPVRLGEGAPTALSPDGRWALAIVGQRDLVLLPVGVGEARHLGYDRFEAVENARWLPDSRRIVALAYEPGHHLRLYLIDVDGTPEKPISDEGFAERTDLALAPDGSRAAAVMADGRLVLVPVAGGAPQPAAGLESGDLPVAWSEDGRSLFVYRKERPPVRIVKVDRRTGRRQLWKELPTSDPAGVATMSNAVMAPDGKSYAYTYQQLLSDLYLVEGLM